MASPSEPQGMDTPKRSSPGGARGGTLPPPPTPQFSAQGIMESMLSTPREASRKLLESFPSRRPFGGAESSSTPRSVADSSSSVSSSSSSGSSHTVIDVGAARTPLALPAPPSSLAPTTPATATFRPSPAGASTPAPDTPAARAAGVLRSLDSLSASVARPVNALVGPISGRGFSASLGQLQSTLQQVSLRELVDGLQRLAQQRRGRGPQRVAVPNKQKLSSVQDFFLYTEAEGRRLFEELDFDADGQVNLADLEHAMKRRRLPRTYARELLRRVRRHWLAKSFGWPEFQALMEQKEPALLRAYTSLSVSASGTLHKEQVLASLRKAGLPASDETAKAMLRFLDVDGEQGQITYGKFRNFLLLLPPERLHAADPSMIWFEAATMVPVGPPAAAGASVLRSALAGGLASGLSTCLMHPLDTIKTRVQASSATLGEVIKSVPSLGVAGLYAGAAPAILGQFTSHGLRTGIFEASKMAIARVRPELTEVQIQPVASLCSTVLGTAIRIPCEVLKQRLQVGMHSGVGEALASTIKEDGVRGLFRGTTATLLREVPFYVFGMLIYLQVKKATKSVLRRELAPWETLLLGGVSGGMAAVAITPFDVLKTRMMTAPQGQAAGLVSVALNILKNEGPMALYKGALPRFFWIAPLGAMNFAGYELAKQALENEKE